MIISDPSGRERVYIVVAVTLAGLVASVLSAIVHSGPWTAASVTLASAAVLCGYVALRRDRVLARLLVVGAVAAVFEIGFADRWAVESGSLVYAEGPRIVASPFYMPFSWIVATLEFLVLAEWSVEKLGVARSIPILAIVGGLNLPLYETLAYDAGWWHYVGSPGAFHTPYYVALGEVLIGGAFPILAPHACVSTERAALAGAILGGWMYVAARIAYALVG